MGRGRRVPRGLLHRPRRPVHPVPVGSGRAGARHRRRRWGGDGRGAAGRRGRGVGGGVGASARAHQAVRALGATAAVAPDEALRSGPFDVALELVGASSLPGVLDALAVGGRIVVIGVSGGGARAEVDLLTLMQRRARISASTLRARSLFDKAAVAGAVSRPRPSPSGGGSAAGAGAGHLPHGRRRLRPTSISPPGGSSAKSSSSRPGSDRGPAGPAAPGQGRQTRPGRRPACSRGGRARRRRGASPGSGDGDPTSGRSG